MGSWFEIIQMISVSVLTASCFAVIFRTPKKYFLHTVAVGMLSSLLLRFAPKNIHQGFTVFSISFLIGCVSHAMARATNQPAQCFLIPGVIVLVPGAFLYRGFSYAVLREYASAGEMFLASLIVTTTISFGLLLANWVFPHKKTL